MVGRNADELGETALKAPAILGPQLVVEKDSYSVESEQLDQTLLTVDAPGVIRARPKHLDLIDGA